VVTGADLANPAAGTTLPKNQKPERVCPMSASCACRAGPRHSFEAEP
jgi:hypothetical protein